MKKNNKYLSVIAIVFALTLLIGGAYVFNESNNKIDGDIDPVIKVINEDNTTKEEENNDDEEKRYETITFPSLDNLEITADFYKIDDSSPIILLFHRAQWSRGEYREIAPRLCDLGYNVLAIDARSGGAINGVTNITAQKAAEAGLGGEYADAGVDIEATINYSINELGYDDIITWGSSYSTVLVIAISEKYNENVMGIITFSPGGYFGYEEKNVMEHAQNLSIPIYLTGGKTEDIVANAILENVASEIKIKFKPEANGVHGSMNLWESVDAHKEHWESLESFLNLIKK